MFGIGCRLRLIRVGLMRCLWLMISMHVVMVCVRRLIRLMFWYRRRGRGRLGVSLGTVGSWRLRIGWLRRCLVIVRLMTLMLCGWCLALVVLIGLRCLVGCMSKWCGVTWVSV